MAREIPLTQGLVALVDDCDFARVSAFRWRAMTGNRQHTNFYAGRGVRVVGGKGKKVLVFMHRFILRAPEGLEVDHINGGGLDNRRANLRLATRSQNCMNREGSAGSGYRGVYRCRGLWLAQIRVDGRLVHLGTFRDPADAARSYDRAAIEQRGEFARLNFPSEHGVAA